MLIARVKTPWESRFQWARFHAWLFFVHWSFSNAKFESLTDSSLIPPGESEERTWRDDNVTFRNSLRSSSSRYSACVWSELHFINRAEPAVLTLRAADLGHTHTTQWCLWGFSPVSWKTRPAVPRCAGPGTVYQQHGLNSRDWEKTACSNWKKFFTELASSCQQPVSMCEACMVMLHTPNTLFTCLHVRGLPDN